MDFYRYDFLLQTLGRILIKWGMSCPIWHTPRPRISSRYKGKIEMNNTLGAQLRKLRVDRHLTQQEVAAALSISNAMISSYECQTRYPSIDTIKKMAEFFCVSTDYLLGLPEKALINVEGLSEEEIYFIQYTVNKFRQSNESK